MTASAQAAAVIGRALAAADVEWEEPDDGTFVAVLPGQARLRTTVALSVGEHALSINAFVARRPDENHEAVYRWLLERNRRLRGVVRDRRPRRRSTSSAACRWPR
ncbi:MAG: YbjN domain-containing protein [Candidatus Nanopelagicales bacterium]